MVLTSWPCVLDEYATVAKLQHGYSLSRFGDGELKCCDGFGYRREPPNRTLAKELRQILSTPMEKLLVGIPTLNPHGPKYQYWLRHKARFLKYLTPDMRYGSAFVSRPDSAPWIETRDYAKALGAVWAGKTVALVAEHHSKLLPVLRATARRVVHIPCVSHGAYAHLDDYQRRIFLDGRPDLVVLSHGVSATCLAHRLTQAGSQALDLGSSGGLLIRMLAEQQQC